MNDKHIEDYILEIGYLSEVEEDEIKELMFQKNLSFVDSLKELNLMDSETFNKLISSILGTKFINLKEINIKNDYFSQIPLPISEENNLICFDKTSNGVIKIAFCDISKIDILENILDKNQKVEFFYAEKREILEKISQYKNIIQEDVILKNEKSINKILKIEDFGFRDKKDLPENYLNDIVSDLNTEKFIEGLFEHAISQKADFIFLTPSEKDILISFRIFDRSYQIMKIDLQTLFSIVSKIKIFCDIDIFERSLVKEGSFDIEILKKKYNIFTTIVHTDFGESVVMEISDGKKFKTDVADLSSSQRNMYLNSLKKDAGFFTIFGKNSLAKKETLYSFLEYDIKKNKEVYSFEIQPNLNLSYIKQISVNKNENLFNVFQSVLKTEPETLAVEDVNKNSFTTLFNYTNFSKKVILSSNYKIEKFIKDFLSLNFNKGQVVKNLSLCVCHENFNFLDQNNLKKYKLSKEELKLIKKYFSNDEILNIFSKEGLSGYNNFNLSKIIFFTKNKNKSKKSFYSQNESIKGVFNLGLFFEKCFLNNFNQIKIKSEIEKEVKKSILENGLILSAKGVVDIIEILKYLKK